MLHGLGAMAAGGLLAQLLGHAEVGRDRSLLEAGLHPRVGQHVHHRGALERVGLEQLGQQVLGRRRDADGHLELGLGDLERGGLLGRGVEGDARGEHGQQQRAEAPHVELGAGVGRVGDDLGRGVVERAHVLLYGLHRRPGHGEAKVAQQHVVVFVEENVLCKRKMLTSVKEKMAGKKEKGKRTKATKSGGGKVERSSRCVVVEEDENG